MGKGIYLNSFIHAAKTLHSTKSTVNNWQHLREKRENKVIKSFSYGKNLCTKIARKLKSLFHYQVAGETASEDKVK